MGNFFSRREINWVVGDPAEEIKLHSQQWKVEHLNVMNFIRAIPLKPSPSSIISSISGIMKALEPSTKDLIRAEILKDFTKTWFGYKISIEACLVDKRDPYDFYRLMIDQLLQRRADFEKLKDEP